MKKISLDQAHVEAGVGEKLELRVKGAGTTGRKWTAIADPELVRIEKYRLPAEGAIGGRGEEVFLFEALKPGKVRVRMQLKPPWSEAADEESEIEIEAIGQQNAE